MKIETEQNDFPFHHSQDGIGFVNKRTAFIQTKRRRRRRQPDIQSNAVRWCSFFSISVFFISVCLSLEQQKMHFFRFHTSLSDCRIICQLMNNSVLQRFSSAFQYFVCSVIYTNKQCALMLVGCIYHDLFFRCRMSPLSTCRLVGIGVEKVECAARLSRSNGKYYSNTPHCCHTESTAVLCVVKQIICYGQVTRRKSKPMLRSITCVILVRRIHLLNFQKIKKCWDWRREVWRA